MADKKFYVIEITAKGEPALRLMKDINKEGDKLVDSQEKVTKSRKKANKGANDTVKQNKAVAGALGSSSHAFSRMAQQMNGIVPVYATVAANVFAITAAFGALERAADFQILIDSADTLATQTGRSLTSLAENMKDITGSAISMKEALVQASIAASAGFDNSTIEQLTQVARNASVALGREMTDSLNRVFKGAIKAEPELLDELGIILRLETAANKYAAVLGKTAKELTTFEKQQAVVNEVLEQGQKKFGRLSEVDPNPFTQLSAAFSEITTNLINFVNVPLGGFITFFTENLSALTAAIVLLGYSVAKQALPALSAMGEGAVAAFVGIGKSAENAAISVQKFTDSRIKAAQSNRVTSTLNADLEAVRESASDAALTKIFDKDAAAADRLRTAIRSVGGSLTALRTKAKKGTLDIAGQKELNRLEKYQGTLKNLQLELSSTTSRTDLFAASTNRLNSVVTAVTGKIALAAGTMASFAVALSNSARNVASAIGPWQTLQFAVLEITAAFSDKETSGFTKFGRTASAAIGSIGAGLFKLVPVIGIATIAWQVLGSTFNAIKKLFGFEDIAKVSEKLDSQADALNKSADAAANFENNLASLPGILANINEQLTLQTNVLAGLAGELKKVNDAIDTDEGFGWLDELLDFVNAGQLDTFKENIPKIIEQIDKLGFGVGVSEDIRELANAFSLGGDAAQQMGKDLQATIEDLQRVSNGAKEANQDIIDGVEGLNKSTAKLFGSLPALSGVDKTLSELSSLAIRLDAQDFEAVADTIQGFSSLTISTLGIENVAEEIASLGKQTIFAEGQIAALKVAIETLQTGAAKNSKANTDAIAASRKQILLLEQGLELSRNLIIEGLGDPLEEARLRFERLSSAARDLKDNLSSLKLDKLNPQNTAQDSIRILKEETRLRIDAIGTQTAVARKALKSIATDNEKIDASRLEAAARLEKFKSGASLNEVEKKRAQSDLNVLASREKVNFENQKKYQSELDKTRGKSADLVIKLFKETTKEINKVVAKQSQGVAGLEDKYISLDNTLKSSAKTLAEITGRTQAWADAILLAQKYAEEREKFLKVNRIAGTNELVKQTYNIETANMGMQAQLLVSRQLNNELFTRADAQWQVADATAAAAIALQQVQVNSAQDAVDAGAPTVEIENANEVRFEEEKAQLTALENARTASRTKNKLELETQARTTIQNMRMELGFLEDKADKGSLFNKMDRQALAIAKMRSKLKGNRPEDIEKIIKLQKDLNKETRKFEFAKSLQEAAESMNDLADGMTDFFKALQDDQFDDFAAGLILLQDIGQDIDGPLGKLTKGFATAALASEQYALQMRNIESSRKAAMDEGPLTQLQLENFELQEQQANYTAIGNAAGALAGAFDEGSSAAKAFTLAQQAAAIASAAAAIATQGEGDPYSAFARIAAMISLMSSVLGAAGIAFGSNSSTGENLEKDYKNRLGSDSLLDRDLQGNYLVDALDELVSIDTQLFSATRDLQITMARLGETFEKIGAVVFASISGDRVTDYANIGETTTQNNEGIVNAIAGLGSSFDALFGGLTGGLFGSVLGSIAGGIFGSTTVTSSVLDTGIDFEALLQVTEDGLTGVFSGLNQLSQVLVKTESSGFLGVGGSSSASLQAITGTLNTDLVAALNTALDQTLNVVNGLINTFAASVGGINVQTLFGNISKTAFGDEFISLFELNAEDAGDAIGLYFSALSSDILKEALPFLADYAIAGEELGETMVRITSDTIRLSNSLSTVGLSLNDVIGDIDISHAAFSNQVINDYVSDSISSIQTSLATAQAELAEYDSHGFSSDGFFSGQGNILRANVRNLEKELANTLVEANTTINSTLTAATGAAAEAFRLEVVAAWEKELLSNFKDIGEFQEIFSMFSKAIFSESELLNQSIDNATANVSNGFSSLINQVDGFTASDLDKLMTEAGGDLGGALRLFYEDALDTGVLNADIISGTEIDTAGASAFATITKLGASIYQLDELLASLEDGITDLNNQYVQQILLFGKLEKEASLLALSFDFSDAIKEAEETGSDIALVEQAFALERLAIIKEAFELIDEEITGAMDSIVDSILEVSQSSDAFNDIAYATIKINKLVERLNKGTSGINLSGLVGDTSGLEDFMQSFQEVIDSMSTEGPGSVSDEIALVDDLRAAIMDRYSLEMGLLEEQKTAFKDLSVEIQGYLADIVLSDASPLTNFERLGEAETQFLANAANIFSNDEEIAAQAAQDLLSSADTYLDAASGFFAIGPEYAAVFDQVTSVLSGIDSELLTRTDDTVAAIEELNDTTIAQLGVLDSILIELQAQNQTTLETDIANNITEGMIPLIGTITDKLQSIDDGTWTNIATILESIASATVPDYESVVTPTTVFTADSLSGEITAEPLSSFAVGTLEVPQDMVARIHQGETIVPESMAQGLREGTLSLGNVQDNSDIVVAIKELTTVLALSQEDIVDAANRNVAVSQDIAESMSISRQPVKTRGVI